MWLLTLLLERWEPLLDQHNVERQVCFEFFFLKTKLKKFKIFFFSVALNADVLPRVEKAMSRLTLVAKATWLLSILSYDPT